MFSIIYRGITCWHEIKTTKINPRDGRRHHTKIEMICHRVPGKVLVHQTTSTWHKYRTSNGLTQERLIYIQQWSPFHWIRHNLANLKNN